jgi:ferredoxin
VILTIDDDACRGHGVCMAVCPELFTLTDAGYAEVQGDTVPPELEELAAEAIAGCPERAITRTKE